MDEDLELSDSSSNSSSYAPEPEPEPDRFTQVVARELDVEIGMRTRLLDVLHSRIAWAEQLQAALKAEKTDDPSATPLAFKAAALEVLAVAEAPCVDLFPPVRLYARPAPPTPAPAPAPAPASAPAPGPRLLYVRGAGGVLAQLACPDCGRTDFPSLQGLVNHCGMRHARALGSHDAALAACAVRVPPAREAEVRAQGTEVAAGLPSLRRLFARAVGEPEAAPPELAAEAPAEQPAALDTALPPGTHLSRTLGIHKDTPALAAFLGREATRRGIRVHDEDVDVDIGDDTAAEVHPPRWRMSFAARSARAVEEADAAEPAEEAVMEAEPAVDAETERVPEPTRDTTAVEGTRFHITTRMVVADRSRWIHLDARTAPNPSHTHQWMLTIESPSYTRHLSTVVSHIDVSCGTPDVDPAFSDATPRPVRAPPYYVRGTTDRPFLAQLTVHLAPSIADREGALANPPLTIEHWVDIGPEGYPHPVAGEEQVLDVELDRNTVFLDECRSSVAFAWNSRDVAPSTARAARTKEEKPEVPDDTSEHGPRLRALLARFPMTIKDAKTRRVPRVPYTLVPTAAHLKSLTYGRRKAIELGRARALCEAYNAELPADGPPPLRAPDVFRWLEAHVHFARPAPAPVVPPPPPPANADAAPAPQEQPARYCGACGLDVRTHREAACRFAGSASLRGPLVVHKLLRPAPAYGMHPAALLPRAPAAAAPRAPWSARALLRAAEPGLVRAVAALMAPGAWEPVEPDLPADEGVLPASALLALALRPLVARLVQGGVAHARRQDARAGSVRRLLTPQHVLYGVRERAAEDTTGAAVLVALSPLGIGCAAEARL